MPSAFLCGSTIQAISAKPMSATPSTVRDRVLALVQDLEAELAGVELLRRVEIGGQQDHVDRMVSEHELSFPHAGLSLPVPSSLLAGLCAATSRSLAARGSCFIRASSRNAADRSATGNTAASPTGRRLRV
jgi:hypothetical protein